MAAGLGLGGKQVELGQRAYLDRRLERPLRRVPWTPIAARESVLGGDVVFLTEQDRGRASTLLHVEPQLSFAQSPSAARPGSQPDPTPFLVGIRRLIELNRIPAARRLLESVPLGSSGHPAVVRLRGVLAPPRVRTVEKRGADRRPEYDWLATEGPRHRGNWVALQGNRLLAVAPTLRELRERLEALALPEPPLFHRVE